MAVTAQDIKDCFGEFSGLDDATVDKFRLQAEAIINISEWGPSKADQGILYMSAHLLKLDKEGNSLAAGPMTQKRVGDVSASFSIPNIVTNEFLAGTAYGRHYLSLRSLVFPCRKL